jgi:hypothetical protein
VDITLEEEKAFWESNGVLTKMLEEAERCTGWK